MPMYLEVWNPAGRDLVPLTSDRVTLGKSQSNDLVIASDPTVSRLHALLERFPAGWSIRDLGSRNGTYVNGARILGERVLSPGDEIGVGKTRLLFRADEPASQGTVTQAAEAPPELTRREREVLLTLCRPVFSGDVFTEPASIREIASELFVTEAAVKQHLLRLYDKFGIYERGERRRVRLANEAIRRGAVTLADLRASGEQGPGPH
ncbi:MAG: FHA domain-containing protein [Actinomycetota bacterium]